MYWKLFLIMVFVTIFKFSHGDDNIYFCPPDENGPPQNCKEVQERGIRASGFYHIKPKYAPESFKVYCNMQTRGGGWTYILNRYDGSQDFYLDWNSYKKGFGNLTGEFWLGLENIHLLTGYEYNELLIELVDWDDKQADAHYDTFKIDSETDGYALKVLEGFSGAAGDSLTHEAGMKFSTKDRDNDVWADDNCATFSNGAWWYRDCKWGHLTGKYLGKDFSQSEKLKGIYWATWHGNTYSLKQVRMMVRPVRPKSLNPLLNI